MEPERASVHDVFDIDTESFESETAKCLIGLGAWRCKRIGVHPFGIVLLEMAVCMVASSRRTDSGTFEERFETEYSHHPLWSWEFEDLDGAVEWLEQLQGKLNTPRGQRFIEKAIGSALWFRIREALRADLKRLRPTIAKWLEDVMPVAHALDVCLGVTTDGESTTTTFLAAAAEATHQLDKFTDGRATDTSGAHSATTRSIDVAIHASEMMRELPELALSEIEKVETPLRRKLRAARDVLGMTEDSVSQAANSAIEFVDRLLRHAYSEDEVLQWLDRHYPDDTDLTFLDDRGQRTPTKKARVLCLLLAGQPPDDGVALMASLAGSLVHARGELQRIKHSDDLRSEVVPEELLQAIAVVEAFIVILTRVAWISRDQETIEALHERLRLDVNTVSIPTSAN